MNSGLYVRAGACATARAAACAISLFGPTTKDSNVFRGLSPGTVAPGLVFADGSGKSFSSGAASSTGSCTLVSDREQNFTGRGPPSVVTMAVCHAGIDLLPIQHR